MVEWHNKNDPVWHGLNALLKAANSNASASKFVSLDDETYFSTAYQPAAEC